MQTNRLIRAEPLPFRPSPQALERLRVYQIVEAKERLRQRQYAAAKRALSICNKLKPSPFKAKHSARILRALNKLRAAA